ncbi:hypothetical protein F5Y09DRAFT_185262 [Xylaria sp. FL1042]|nr:hypothetical protein F5Y09DRAFT_185262 [Xylaria sp. FL1042]
MDIGLHPEAVLCDVCASIISEHSYERWSKHWLRKEEGSHVYSTPGLHHRSFQSLKSAQAQGCYICCGLKLRHWDPWMPFPMKYNLRLLSRGYKLCLMGKTENKGHVPHEFMTTPRLSSQEPTANYESQF